MCYRTSAPSTLWPETRDKNRRGLCGTARGVALAGYVDDILWDTILWGLAHWSFLGPYSCSLCWRRLKIWDQSQVGIKRRKFRLSFLFWSQTFAASNTIDTWCETASVKNIAGKDIKKTHFRARTRALLTLELSLFHVCACNIFESACTSWK